MFEEISQDLVHGFLHRPEQAPAGGLVLTHGAGSDCRAPLLVALAEALAGEDIAVLRCDLPFRQARPHGSPHPAGAERDRAGLKQAAEYLRGIVGGPVWLGGHSYGGRQATMLAAAEPDLADALLLLSYPLHPPHRPDQLRTAHFPDLRTPALFAHGSRDPFGSIEEMRAALALIPARTQLVEFKGAAHGLDRKAAPEIARAFVDFLAVAIPITDVFDLHTVAPRDVKGAVEAYLDEARRLGLKALRIIHGRGIGVQRETVRAVLERTPFVASFADAPAEAGGWGATIVTLR